MIEKPSNQSLLFVTLKSHHPDLSEKNNSNKYILLLIAGYSNKQTPLLTTDTYLLLTN